MNLEIDETRGPGIYFLGNSWPLDAESRQRALDSLRRDLALLRRDEILLRAAYRLPWADLRDVLRVLGDPALRIGRVAFAVASSDPSEWREARIDADPLVGPASPAAPLVLVWSMADGPVLDIGGGATVMAFPAGEPYTAPVVGPSNLLWRRLLGALGEARAGATTSVVLRIDPRVPWAHVAQTLGLVVARGPADVSIEGGLRWRMSTPTRSPDRLGGPGRELVDLHPAVAVGIGVGLALAAVGLVAAGSRRRPRRPPST